MPRRQRSLSSFYHCLEAITGEPVEFADLVQELAGLRRSEVIRWVCELTVHVARPEAHERSFQLKLASEMLSDELFRAAQKLPATLEDAQGYFFHRRQLWFLLQTALLACKESSPEIPATAQKERIGRCCLMVNDLLGQIESEQSGPLPNPEGALHWSVALAVSFLDVYWSQEAIGRADLFWREIPDLEGPDERLASTEELDTAFTKKYGLTLSRFTSILLLFYCRVLRYAMKTPPTPFFIEVPLMFGGHFSDAELSLALGLVSSTADDSAARLLGTTRHSWANDFTPFEKRPLIEVFPGKYACPDLGLLRRFFEHGIRELLSEAFSARRFKELFGHLFERYIERLLGEVFPSSQILANTFHRKVRFERCKTDQACDGLLCWDRFAVALEYKAGTLTGRHRFATRVDETIQAINQLLASDDDKKGVGQLVKSMRRMLNGERVRTESEVLDLSGYSKLHPALVVYDEAFGNHLVREHLNERLRQSLARHQVAPDRIGTLLLFTTRDIEVFERLAPSVGAEALLREYTEFVEKNPRVETGMFRTWAGGRFEDDQFGTGLVDRQSEVLLTRLAEDLRAKESLTNDSEPGR